MAKILQILYNSEKHVLQSVHLDCFPNFGKPEIRMYVDVYTHIHLKGPSYKLLWAVKAPTYSRWDNLKKQNIPLTLWKFFLILKQKSTWSIHANIIPQEDFRASPLIGPRNHFFAVCSNPSKSFYFFIYPMERNVHINRTQQKTIDF
jgi:hypothetical protein